VADARACGDGRLDLYRSKGRIAAGFAPLLGWLERSGVSPDALTLAAIPVAAVGGVCLLISPAVPLTLLAVPLLIGLRLILNILDGALARSTGRSHARGEWYNEVGDRLADLAFIVPVAFLPGANQPIVLLGAVGAVLASFAGLAVRAAGSGRVYRGILSKPGRMVLLAVFSVAAFALGQGAWWWFGPLLLAGTSVTFVERVLIALRELA
jgi:CDP-diacylglycerol--glycerol-3-phosphate 3-phosphatidyltransferase